MGASSPKVPCVLPAAWLLYCLWGPGQACSRCTNPVDGAALSVAVASGVMRETKLCVCVWGGTERWVSLGEKWVWQGGTCKGASRGRSVSFSCQIFPGDPVLSSVMLGIWRGLTAGTGLGRYSRHRHSQPYGVRDGLKEGRELQKPKRRSNGSVWGRMQGGLLGRGNVGAELWRFETKERAAPQGEDSERPSLPD